LRVCRSQDVVFDHRKIEFFRELQHSKRDVRAHVGAGRILHHRLREVDARLVLLGEFFERGDIGSVGIARNAQEPSAVQPQIAEQIVVSRVVDEHRIAGLDEMAHDEVERLTGAVRQDDLRCARGNAELG
jgi:hypothetical protein